MNHKAQSRLTQFRQYIRRTQIQKIKSEFRKYSELDLTTVDQVAALMKLPPKPELQKYTFKEIMSLAAQSLVKPHLSPFAIQDESNCPCIPIQAHIRFWKLLSEHLNQNPETDMQQVTAILLFIIKKHTYQSVHYNTTYELHLLNTLELVAPRMTTNNRDEVLDWVAGAEGLRVIEACLPQNSQKGFLIYRNYVRVYRVLQLGLRSEFKSQSLQAAKILTKILKQADFDETFSVYQNAQGLMSYLCMKVQRYCQKEETEVYNVAIMLLIDSYDEAILNYARAGVAYVAALLITSSIDSNRSEGLQILRILCQVDGRKMIIFLLDNHDLMRTRLWEQLLTTQNFSKSKNIKIRRNYFSVLESLLSNGEKQDVQQLCSRFADRYEDIFDMLVQCLQNEDEVFILIRAVGCLSSLMYIANQNEAAGLLQQTFDHKGITKALQQLSKHQNEYLCKEAENTLNLLDGKKQPEGII